MNTELKCPCGRPVAKPPMLVINDSQREQAAAAKAGCCVTCYQVNSYIQAVTGKAVRS